MQLKKTAKTFQGYDGKKMKQEDKESMKNAVTGGKRDESIKGSVLQCAATLPLPLTVPSGTGFFQPQINVDSSRTCRDRPVCNAHTQSVVKTRAQRIRIAGFSATFFVYHIWHKFRL